MRRVLAFVLASAALVPVAACGSSSPAAAPAPSPAASSAGSDADVGAGDFPELRGEPSPDLAGLFTSAQACEAADVLYAEPDETWQRYVRDGAAAERRGDKAAAARALKALNPFFTSTSATFGDAAAKVTDPALRAALTSLAEASAKEATFTTFAEFEQLAELTAPAEAVLKLQCPRAGYRLRNIT